MPYSPAPPRPPAMHGPSARIDNPDVYIYPDRKSYVTLIDFE